MIKLNYKNAEVAKPLIAERIIGAQISERCPIDYIFPIIELNMMSDIVSVFVDREVDPQSALILAFVPAAVCNESAVIINLIYVSDKVRAENPRLSIELMNEMFSMAEGFAKSKRADVLQAASWVYRGAPDISSILEHKGFEPQTREFVKFLNQSDL